jgi:SAM-dependent methyltransferase
LRVETRRTTHRPVSEAKASPSRRATDARLLALLACPHCHGPVLAEGADGFRCAGCGIVASCRGGVICAGEQPGAADFDALHEVMEQNNDGDAIWRLMYRRQAELVSKLLKPRGVLLDVGCGPRVPYRVGQGVSVVGVEPSFPAIARNRDLDLALCGSAAALPLAPGSVDAAVCLYSVPHMVGGSVAETRENVRAVFRELLRVLKPGGELLVFEVSPWPPFRILQQRFWGLARRLFGARINFLFWSQEELRSLVAALAPGAVLETQRYDVGWWETFPPAFALQRLRIPRLLYPFSVNLNRWRK